MYSFSYNPTALDLNNTNMSQTLTIPVQILSSLAVACFVSECFMQMSLPLEWRKIRPLWDGLRHELKVQKCRMTREYQTPEKRRDQQRDMHLLLTPPSENALRSTKTPLKVVQKQCSADTSL